MSDAVTTTDHEEIREWIEERDGYPAKVNDTGSWDDVGVLRVAFRDKGDELDALKWDAFFEVFEANDLAFLYQETTADGATSRFCKFVSQES